jgi:hypothetical protein
MTAVLFTLKSRNAKTGPIAVTTSSRETCPSDCPLKGKGCYAENGPLGGLWRGLTSAGPLGAFRNGLSMVRTLDWAGLLERVAGLPEGALWRHNQAGDLPHRKGKINREAVRQLVEANRGKRGWTYTHHDMRDRDNRSVVRQANAGGFAVNLSADDLGEADQLAALGIGPVVVVLPESQRENVRTPEGRLVVVCPAIARDDVTCASCGLCAVRDRKVVVGFPAHGARKGAVSSV